MKILTVLTLLLVAGCATCREQPVACGAAILLTGAIAVRHIAYPDAAHGDRNHQPVHCGDRSCQ